jgi:hypothetical protein
MLMLAASKGDFHLVSELLTMISEKNVNAVDYVSMHELATLAFRGLNLQLMNRMD